ncbi:MAG TPA: hypothetical protein VFY20_08405 [Gemmatimonadales bacterium]|nr:hypothetical protein [Gemmatimonadales bacterium]
MRTSRNAIVLALLLLPAGVMRVAAQAPAAALLAGALAAAPDSMRPGATVVAWEGGKARVLKQGSNGLVCVADEPGNARVETACYHESLEPFMARGRELKALKKTRAEIDSIRLADIKGKRYTFPSTPVALYNLAGPADSLDAQGVPANPMRWYVVYTPYATPQSTGLSLMPDGTGRPWLMYPGKPWAHIMITPN